MPTLLDALVETPPRVEPEPGRSPRTIGTAHQPVRVIAFSSGGFDAAMQLGVTHALLTINGKAPDAAVGVSAGAVNAAALAEVFQAAPDPADWPDLDPAARDQMLHDRQRARVARFRKMLEACLSAPGELARAMLPDTLQVEAQQPLRPLELPIHERKERDGRQKELHARQGFINLFNDLLGLKVSFGTLTRLFRRMLGWQAAAEIRSTAGRLAARSFELARVWALIAVNFPRAAWVIQRLVAPLFTDRAKPRGEAATAAAIIFRPRWLRALRRVLVRAVMTLLLFLLWITISLCVIGVPFLALRLLSGALWVLGGSLDLTGPARVAAWLDQNLPVLLAILYAVLGGALAIGLWMTGAWGHIANFNRTRPRAVLGEAGLEAVGFGLLLAGSLVPPFALFGLVGWMEGQRTLGGMLERGLVIGEHVFWWLLLVLAGGFAYAWSRNAKDSYLQRLLARYDIADGLLSTHPLRQFFIPLFDPEYYGERQMDDVVDRALRDNYDPSVTGPRPPKVIASYERQSPPITVGLMVANVKTGNLEIVPDCTKVVDGLIAATSVSPLFPPVPILGKLYLDGANISTEAIPGVITLLRDRVNPAA
ncbi:MAG TPA: patatin-like phospholipase family protein, partial [Gemmatimonadales bacterium]